MLIKRFFGISARLGRLTRMSFAKQNNANKNSLPSGKKGAAESNISEKTKIPHELMKFNNQLLKKNFEKRQMTPTASTADMDLIYEDLDPDVEEQYLNELFDPILKDEKSLIAVDLLYKQAIKGQINSLNSANIESNQANSKLKVNYRSELNDLDQGIIDGKLSATLIRTSNIDMHNYNKNELDISKYFISDADNSLEKVVSSNSRNSAKMIDEKGQIDLPKKRSTKKVKDDSNEVRSSNKKMSKGATTSIKNAAEFNLIEMDTKQNSLDLYSGTDISAILKDKAQIEITSVSFQDLEGNASHKKRLTQKNTNGTEFKITRKSAAKPKLHNDESESNSEVVIPSKRRAKSTLPSETQANLEGINPKKRNTKKSQNALATIIPEQVVSTPKKHSNYLTATINDEDNSQSKVPKKRITKTSKATVGPTTSERPHLQEENLSIKSKLKNKEHELDNFVASEPLKKKKVVIGKPALRNGVITNCK